MSSRPYPPALPRLIGYDPAIDLPSDHLARLVDTVVESAVAPGSRERRRGRPAYDLRLCIKVLVYGYSTGVRSSRQLERLCSEHLAYLYLTRGDTPSYRTLCTVRTSSRDLVEAVWLALFEVAGRYGLSRLGRIVVDSSKFRADAGTESVLSPDEYVPMLEELQRILTEAEQADQREEEEGGGSGTRLGQSVPGDQMRDIVRRVRSGLAKQKKGLINPVATEAVGLSERMRQRVEQSIPAIEEALEEGRKHLCLTDPDARMMPEGIQQRIREGYSFEIAVDGGLIVAGQTTQIGSDQLRLSAVVDAAASCEPAGISAVDADSGYYSGDAVASLIASGIDVCIPDSHTACDLHRGEPIGTARQRAFGAIPMHYVAEQNHYTCPEGNVLRFQKTKRHGGQMVSIYIAERACAGCPLASQCLTQANAKRRQLSVGFHHEILQKERERFRQPEHQERYHNRGHAVETVFGFLRAALGFTRWTLRGKEKIACEGSLFKTAYQFRKVMTACKQASTPLRLANMPIQRAA